MATRQSNEIMAISPGSDPPRQWKLGYRVVRSVVRLFAHAT
jgi:hypothetical protein